MPRAKGAGAARAPERQKENAASHATAAAEPRGGSDTPERPETAAADISSSRRAHSVRDRRAFWNGKHALRTCALTRRA
jgi:hypothetical protein